MDPKVLHLGDLEFAEQSGFQGEHLGFLGLPAQAGSLIKGTSSTPPHLQSAGGTFELPLLSMPRPLVNLESLRTV